MQEGVAAPPPPTPTDAAVPGDGQQDAIPSVWSAGQPFLWMGMEWAFRISPVTVWLVNQVANAASTPCGADGEVD